VPDFFHLRETLFNLIGILLKVVLFKLFYEVFGKRFSAPIWFRGIVFNLNSADNAELIRGAAAKSVAVSPF